MCVENPNLNKMSPKKKKRKEKAILTMLLENIQNVAIHLDEEKKC